MNHLIVALFGPLHEWDAPILVSLLIVIAAVWAMSIWPRAFFTSVAQGFSPAIIAALKGCATTGKSKTL